MQVLAKLAHGGHHLLYVQYARGRRRRDSFRHTGRPVIFKRRTGLAGTDRRTKRNPLVSDQPIGQHEAVNHEAIEALTLVVAHLAAQLTMTQIRLRGLATYLERQSDFDPVAVQGCVTRIADAEAGYYLRENLGERLAELIDVEQLTRDIIEFVSDPQ